MTIKLVIAVIPSHLLKELERALASTHAPGLTITKVKGHGPFNSYFVSDITGFYSKVEIFVEESGVPAIQTAISDVTIEAKDKAGIISVIPTETFMPLHTTEAKT